MLACFHHLASKSAIFVGCFQEPTKTSSICRGMKPLLNWVWVSEICAYKLGNWKRWKFGECIKRCLWRFWGFNDFYWHIVGKQTYMSVTHLIVAWMTVKVDDLPHFWCLSDTHTPLVIFQILRMRKIWGGGTTPHRGWWCTAEVCTVSSIVLLLFLPGHDRVFIPN